MKKLLTIIFVLLTATAQASPPTRAYTYVANNTIDPNQNNTNENALYSYLQSGVDTYAAGSITGAAISSSASIPYVSLSLSNSIVNADISSSAAIAASKLSLGGIVLPSGAGFYMFTGSCPAGSTDSTSTYSNKFVRINATAGSTGGADTHTHAAGSFAVSGTTGGVQNVTAGTGPAIGANDKTHDHSFAASVTGTSAAGDNVPAYVTAKLCIVN